MVAKAAARPFVFYVAGLALALILPAFIFSAVVAYHWVSAEKDRLETNLKHANERVAAEVDLYLGSVVAMLQVLATSPALDGGDFERFDQQVRGLSEWQKVNVALRDRSGRMVINTRFPPGSTLPRVALETDRRVEATRKPDITDEMTGAVSGEAIVIVNVPVLRAGEVRYFLSAILPKPVLQGVLKGTATASAPVFSVTIADSGGTILAATGSDPTTGQIPAHLRSENAAGRWAGPGSTGAPVLTRIARSSLSGWVIATSVDQATMEAPLHRSEWLLANLSLILTALALLVASMATRKMVLAHQRVAQAAKLLGHGVPFQAPETAVQEVNLIGQEIAAAGIRLREQADALAAANNELEQRVDERTQELALKTEMLEATLDNMDQGLMMIDPKGYVAVCNRRAIELLDLPADLMQSDPDVGTLRAYRADQEDFTHEEGASPAAGLYAYERETPNGSIVEIRTVPLPGGGAVRTFTDVTARRSSERQSQHMARHDPLTDLPNRTLFRERLNQRLAEIRRYGGNVAVLSLDLDRFKVVNDTWGHPAGDALLREVADRIRATLRIEDTVARFGGDEFAIIQVAAGQPMAASTLCTRLIEAISAPIMIEGHEVVVGASIGIAIADEAGEDADQIFKNSDRALYRAKGEGRGTFRFYEPAMEISADLRRRLELDLKGALPQGEFILNFQPMLNVASSSIEGFEALLRWQHPTRGLVAPSDFISVAEEMGLIIPIGEWVLREACREAASWPGLTVAVNISGLQFSDGNILHHVVSALSCSGLSPHYLELEITETVLMNDSEAAAATLHQLRALGVRIALDDFGTGYSSLSYLHKFPFDKIKIDRSFVKEIDNPDTAAIVRAIVGLGAQLGTAITAEGVETQAQFEYVLAEGCTEVQGYLIGRPLSAADARRLLSLTQAELRAVTVAA